MAEIDQNPTELEQQHEHEYQPSNGHENELEYQPDGKDEYQPEGKHEYQPENEHEYQPENDHEYQPENEHAYQPENEQEYQPEAEHENEQEFVHEFAHVHEQEDKHETEGGVPEIRPDEEKSLTNEAVDGGGDRWPGWPGESVFRMLVPAQKVGSIIGRKGEYIKKTCEETKARIKILDGPPGTRERAVSKTFDVF